jgi:hypothetical protein
VLDSKSVDLVQGGSGLEFEDSDMYLGAARRCGGALRHAAGTRQVSPVGKAETVGSCRLIMHSRMKLVVARMHAS